MRLCRCVKSNLRVHHQLQLQRVCCQAPYTNAIHKQTTQLSRASSGGTTGGTATAPSVTVRSHATSSSVKGIVVATDRTGDLFTNDFTRNVVATPPCELFSVMGWVVVVRLCARACLQRIAQLSCTHRTNLKHTTQCPCSKQEPMLLS